MSASLAESILDRVRRALGEAKVPYMLTGSFASSLHGAPRVTQDIDIVIAPTLGTLTALLEQFPDSQYYVSRDAALQAYGSESMFNVVDLHRPLGPRTRPGPAVEAVTGARDLNVRSHPLGLHGLMKARIGAEE